MFMQNDKTQLIERNVSETQVEEQVARLLRGTTFVHLMRPAVIGDGIVKMDETNIQEALEVFENDRQHYHFTKFVPASGAATRMFKAMFAYLENPSPENFPSAFFNQIHKFAFYESLNEAVVKNFNLGIDQMTEAGRYAEIVDTMLNDKGLSYGKLPKALLKFHRYENFNRLALEEHLSEAAKYAQNEDGKCHLHFTVSPEHESLFRETIEAVKPQYEQQYGVQYEITLSNQKPSTDTVAIDAEGKLFRNSDGSILFRPGGHGALIENLNDLQEEIVFIKNIDNIVPEHHAAPTYLYKKVLAGYLMNLQQITFEYLGMLDDGDLEDVDLEEMAQFAQHELQIDIPEFFKDYTDIEKIDFLYEKLNRPMRVCGMVKNEGEPGGGPFWTKNDNDEISLQIVESSQIDHNNESQESIFKSSTHFNPVDLVCSCWDYQGEPFNLTEHVDPNTCFISSKSKDGRELKALELPGLWNGAMADWITVFVEVPIETFNPVKTVNDLLKPMHQ